VDYKLFVTPTYAFVRGIPIKGIAVERLLVGMVKKNCVYDSALG
jgi:hypothetical protein